MSLLKCRDAASVRDASRSLTANAGGGDQLLSSAN